MSDSNLFSSPPIKVKENGTRMDGVATLLQFGTCQGIIMAANMRDLKKLARGVMLADFDPNKAKRVTLRRR